jgi:hypothetical protein
MTTEDKTCRICGSELSAANSFTCRRCGRGDVCIMHKGSASGLCSVCLTGLRRRVVYPMFSLITFVMIFFSPALFASVHPIIIFLLVLFLFFWIFLESTRPVITQKKLKAVAWNIFIIAIVVLVGLIGGWDLLLKESQIKAPKGLSLAVFLFTGVLLICFGFLVWFSISMRNFGVSLFDYDYPEECSVLLKQAGKDPEKVGILKWDARWISTVSFIFGLLFLYAYLQISSKI